MSESESVRTSHSKQFLTLLQPCWILTLNYFEQFWHFQFLTISDHDTCRFWLFPIFAFEGFWHFPILLKNGFWHFPVTHLHTSSHARSMVWQMESFMRKILITAVNGSTREDGRFHWLVSISCCSSFSSRFPMMDIWMHPDNICLRFFVLPFSASRHFFRAPLSLTCNSLLQPEVKRLEATQSKRSMAAWYIFFLSYLVDTLRLK